MKDKCKQYKIKTTLHFFLVALCLTFCSCVRSNIGQPVILEQQDEMIAQAFQNNTSDIFVESFGIVEKILVDDTAPPRHQRFIIRLETGQTLLVAHNIDIAPRIKDLSVGEQLAFRGEYEWNSKGGVIHWTHHDPRYMKPGGWIKYKDRTYK